MSTNPPSFRLPFTLPDDIHPAVALAIRQAFNGLAVHEQAFSTLTAKVNANTNAVATATTTPTAAVSGGGGFTSSTAGAVNNQTGNTSYSIAATDFGALIILNTSSSFALTLNNAVNSPFYCVVNNYGTAVAVLTPGSGTVNNAASVTLAVNASALVFYDGTNWWATTLPSFPLTGKSASLGGSVMTAGQTVSITVAITGATVGMVAVCNPETYPGDGFVWDAYISSANTVAVRLTCVLAGTPVSSLYDVRVTQ